MGTYFFLNQFNQIEVLENKKIDSKKLKKMTNTVELKYRCKSKNKNNIFLLFKQ